MSRYLQLDFANPEYREQVARQCEAAVKSGVVDGVMLDWWEDDADRLALVTAIRKRIGEEALILVNASLFSDPNPLPTPDHLHDWYPFWERSLGRISGPGLRRRDGAISREYERGTAVYNPMGNQSVTIRFGEPRTSRATGRRADSHALAACDGDFYLKAADAP